MSLIPERWRQPLPSPTGQVVWLCVTAAGGKSAWESEALAEEHALLWKGAVVYPVVVETEEIA